MQRTEQQLFLLWKTNTRNHRYFPHHIRRVLVNPLCIYNGMEALEEGANVYIMEQLTYKRNFFPYHLSPNCWLMPEIQYTFSSKYFKPCIGGLYLTTSKFSIFSLTFLNNIYGNWILMVRTFSESLGIEFSGTISPLMAASWLSYLLTIVLKMFTLIGDRS